MLSIVILAPNITYPMLLQQEAQQPADQAVQPANPHQLRQLGLQAARVILDQPRQTWYKDTPAEKIMKTENHFCRDAIAVETKNSDYAFNHLFEDVGSIYSHHFPQIVAHDILRQINSRPAFILSHWNLLNAVLPKISSKNVSKQKKQSVFFTLALILFHSQEFRHAQQTYFPNIAIEPDQLNLEQILLLLLIAPSQNHGPLLINLSQANAHNILTQRIFKTLPQPLQQILRAQLSPLQINHLTRRNAIILTMFDTLGLFLKKPKELTFPIAGITETDVPKLDQRPESITGYEIANIVGEDACIQNSHSHPKAIIEGQIMDSKMILRARYQQPKVTFVLESQDFPKKRKIFKELLRSNKELLRSNPEALFFLGQLISGRPAQLPARERKEYEWFLPQNLTLNSLPEELKPNFIERIIDKRKNSLKNSLKWFNYEGVAQVSLNFLLPLLPTVQPQQPLFLGTCFTYDLNIKMRKLVILHLTNIALHYISQKSLSSKLIWLSAGRNFLRCCDLLHGLQGVMPGMLNPRLEAALANLGRINNAINQIENLPYYSIKRVADWIAFRAAAFEAAHR